MAELTTLQIALLGAIALFYFLIIAAPWAILGNVGESPQRFLLICRNCNHEARFQCKPENFACPQCGRKDFSNFIEEIRF